jgi:hypothetical protein
VPLLPRRHTVGDLLWRSQVFQLSECLEISDPGHEVGGDSGRVGGLGLVSDCVVVFDFVDKDGDRATEDLLDQAVGVELVGQLDACLDESLRDLVASGSTAS